MSVAIAMILVRGDGAIDEDHLVSELNEHWPDVEDVSVERRDDVMLSLDSNAGQSVLALMPCPIPWSDLKGPCATSILWNNATEEVRPHTSHWIVTVMGDQTPVDKATLLTKVTAAALEASPTSIGVYWGDATLLIPKELFLNFAKDVLPEGPPVPIWVDFRIGMNDDGTSYGFTAGMRAFDLMEFETLSSPDKPSELHDRLMSLAGYLIENGPVIQDGHTVGRDASEKVHANYSPSKFGHKEEVIRLEFGPPAKKSRWKFW